MEGCCDNMVRYIMVFWNILFTIVGFVLIGFGAWSQIAAKDYLNFLGENYINTPIFLIIVGGVICVVALLGCCGAWAEKKWLMMMYAAFLVIILVAQIGAGIAAYWLKGDLSNEVSKNMNDAMDNYRKPDFDGVTHTWDIVQKTLHCCGVEDFNDWAKNRNDTFKDGQTPDSCCKEGEVENCGTDPTKQKYEEGCFDLFETQFVDNIGTVGGVALGVAALEFFVVLIACCLGKRMGVDQIV